MARHARYCSLEGDSLKCVIHVSLHANPTGSSTHRTTFSCGIGIPMASVVKPALYIFFDEVFVGDPL